MDFTVLIVDDENVEVHFAIPSAFYPDVLFPVSKSHCYDLFTNFAKAIIPLLLFAVACIFCNNAFWISKCLLGQNEWNAVFFLIRFILVCFFKTARAKPLEIPEGARHFGCFEVQ
jgi:hypothetical protein